MPRAKKSPSTLTGDRAMDAEMNQDGATKLVSWSPFGVVLLGGVILWLAFPPLGLFPLAWLAPWPWFSLIAKRQLVGRRPHAQLYCGGFATWLLLLQWVRLPHWAAWFGWFALAALMGCYFLLFFVATRALVHRARWPLWIAAPVVWTGIELLRSYLFTGFSMLLIGHTLYEWPVLIQVADIWGAYAVSFVVMSASALLYAAVTRRPVGGINGVALGAAIALVGAQATYGVLRTFQTDQLQAANPRINVLLVQGAIDTTFDPEQDIYESRSIYTNLTRAALRQGPQPDVIVWPESMYSLMVHTARDPRTGEMRCPSDARLPAGELQRWQMQEHALLKRFANEWQADLILGCINYDYCGDRVRRFNTALFVDKSGEVKSQYHKMHPVLFGEYVPLGNWFPWLYRLTPMSQGLDAGATPEALAVNGVVLSPLICFENTVPHLVRRQVKELRADGIPPDALVTITNDGWFWGSSLLDLHLACGVFRAVEHHLPMLIAANTGISASIDATGTVLQRGPKRAEGVVNASVSAAGDSATAYQVVGDCPAGLCAVAAVYGLILAGLGRWSRTNSDG